MFSDKSILWNQTKVVGVSRICFVSKIMSMTTADARTGVDIINNRSPYCKREMLRLEKCIVTSLYFLFQP